MRDLILYFSRAGENYFFDGKRYVNKGNTAKLAELVHAITGGTLCSVEMQKPYADDYDTCIEQARVDLKNHIYPDVKALPNNVDQYDRIIVMYPNYWGHIPMALATVLHSIDTEGKTMQPICTHEGSGMGSTESDIKKLCPKAKVLPGLAIQGSFVDGSEARLRAIL